MRLKLLSCRIFHREIACLAAESPHQIDIEFLPQELHVLGRKPMKKRLAEFISNVDKNAYDAILLGYALCNGGIAGLKANSIPLIIPRAHDCITLFLGSRKRYKDYFFTNGGTYFMTAGWLEQENILNFSSDCVPYYSKLTFIETGIEPEKHTLETQIQRAAEERNWKFEKISGDLSLLRRFLRGDWNDDFLIVPPGKQIQESFDDNIIELT